MADKAPRIVVFSEKELHHFYKSFAAGMGSTEVLGCCDAPVWIHNGQADLVFIDCGFRIKKGLDFLREIKRASPRTMVVIVTEKSSEETVIEAFHAGARQFIKKPVSLSSLRSVARSLLKLKKEAKEVRSPYVEKASRHPAPAGEVVSGKPANLMRAVQFIEENLGEALDLDAVAKVASLSRFQVCRAFKQHFGMPPMKFVNTLRIDRAQELLRRQELNITEVAMNVGFRDHGSFIRAFKRHAGVLPKTFRDSIEDGPPA
jgi:transcriptional regulator GlxA family with amidase domain